MVMTMSFLTQHCNEIIIFITTPLGAIFHYAKKRLRNQTDVTCKDWFGKADKNGSILAAGSVMFSVVSVLSSGAITPELPFWPVVMHGLTLGFTIDSLTNSDGTSKTEPSPKEQ